MVIQVIRALRDAYTLTYGRIWHRKKTGVKNRYIRRYLRLVNGYLHRGLGHVSRWAHIIRKYYALRAGDPSQVPNCYKVSNFRRNDAKNFLCASSVKRCVWNPVVKPGPDAVQPPVVKNAIEKAEDSWIKPRDVTTLHPAARAAGKEYDPAVLSELKIFCRKIFSSTSPPLERALRVPNNHSCLERKRTEGGNAAALKAQLDRLHREKQILSAIDAEKREFKHFRGEYGREAQKLEERSTPSNVYDLYTEVVEAFNHSNTPDVQAIKPLALDQFGSKIRVATMHPAMLAWGLRQLNNRFLPLILRHKWAREPEWDSDARGLILRRSRKHVGNRKLHLYSSDFTKASDYIPWDVARTILTEFSRTAGLSRAEDRMLAFVAGPKEMPDCERETVRGLHMGLSFAWGVLSVLNAFAAYKACGSFSAFQTCGDDLIGLFTRSEADAYEDVITRTGIILNKSKSFRGRGGVFCEHLIERTGWFTAIGHPLATLAELSAVRAQTGQSKGTATLAHLSGLIHGPWLKRKGKWYHRRSTLTGTQRRIAVRTATHLGEKWRRVPGLPAAFGGNGLIMRRRLSAKARGLIRGLLHAGKKMPTIEAASKSVLPDGLAQSSDCRRGGGGVSLQDLAAVVKANRDRLLFCKGETVPVAKPSFKTEQYWLGRKIRSSKHLRKGKSHHLFPRITTLMIPSVIKSKLVCRRESVTVRAIFRLAYQGYVPMRLALRRARAVLNEEQFPRTHANSIVYPAELWPSKRVPRMGDRWRDRLSNKTSSRAKKSAPA